jgi:hypothetical protein
MIAMSQRAPSRWPPSALLSSSVSSVTRQVSQRCYPSPFKMRLLDRFVRPRPPWARWKARWARGSHPWRRIRGYCLQGHATDERDHCANRQVPTARAKSLQFPACRSISRGCSVSQSHAAISCSAVPLARRYNHFLNSPSRILLPNSHAPWIGEIVRSILPHLNEFST